MCGRGRNKPSRGEPHFLIASFPSFPLAAPHRHRARRRTGWKRKVGEIYRVIVYPLSRTRRCSRADCKWRRVYVRSHREHTIPRVFGLFSRSRVARVTPRYCESFFRVVDLWTLLHGIRWNLLKSSARKIFNGIKKYDWESKGNLSLKIHTYPNL